MDSQRTMPFWRAFEGATSSSTSSLSVSNSFSQPSPAPIYSQRLNIKEEPICSESPSSPLPEPIDNNDIDLYFKEFVKVEAILDAENIQKFIIPIDVPYTGPSGNRMNKQFRATKTPHQSPTIGKIRMRKISEMQRLPRQPRRYKEVPCSCYLCRICKYYPYIQPAPVPNIPVTAAYSRAAVQSRIWRPFI